MRWKGKANFETMPQLNGTDLVKSDDPGVQLWVEDEFSAAASQTGFTLSQTPVDTGTLMFIVNGIVYDDVTDYTISGVNVTWTDTAFIMSSGDKVIAKYK